MTEITLSPAFQTSLSNLRIKSKQNIESNTVKLIITIST